jgi:Transglycosylase SLT domain
MRVEAVQAIESRMASIESRFGRTHASSGRLGADLVGSDEPAAAATPFADVLADATTEPLVPTRGGVAVDVSPTDQATLVLSTAVGGASADLGGAVAPGTPFATNFEVAGATYGVPPRLLAAVGWVESRYTVDAVSPDGALGVMQIMPTTAHELGVDPNDPDQAIDGAARLLADHHRRFGSWDLALAAYHSGAGAVSRAGNAAPPRAAEYVRLVHERLERT